MLQVTSRWLNIYGIWSFLVDQQLERQWILKILIYLKGKTTCLITCYILTKYLHMNNVCHQIWNPKVYNFKDKANENMHWEVLFVRLSVGDRCRWPQVEMCASAPRVWTGRRDEAEGSWLPLCSRAKPADISGDEIQRQSLCASRGSCCCCCSSLRPTHTITKSLSFSEQTLPLCNLYVNGLSQGFCRREARFPQLADAFMAVWCSRGPNQ